MDTTSFEANDVVVVIVVDDFNVENAAQVVLLLHRNCLLAVAACLATIRRTE
ncbi:hypothetical protein D3C80_2043210 [compost metagenome]